MWAKTNKVIAWYKSVFCTRSFSFGDRATHTLLQKKMQQELDPYTVDVFIVAAQWAAIGYDVFSIL